MVGFYDYLSRPSAGFKKKSIRLQHAGQVRILLEHIDPKGDDITCLALDVGDAVWSRWVKDTLENGSKKSGTVISYLTSFEKFLQYVTNPRYNCSRPPLHQGYIDTFIAILPEIKGWRSTVDGCTQDKQNQRYMDESDALITPEEMAELKASKPYVEGIKAIKQADEGKVLMQQEFTLARDVLLVCFAVDNATRPGPLNNATLADYEKADTAKGKRIMLVARHKQAKDRPAIFGMMPDLQELMEMYIRKVRPQFTKAGVDHLFVTVEGTAFPEGTIGRRVSSFFDKTKLRIGERLPHVNVTKFVTTQTEEGTLEEAAIVQHLMSRASGHLPEV